MLVSAHSGALCNFSGPSRCQLPDLFFHMDSFMSIITKKEMLSDGVRMLCW